MDDLEVKPVSWEGRPSFPQVAEVKVPQNENKEVVIPQTDKKVHLIHTVKRIGCDASLLLTIESNGTEHVVVTHYDPEHIEKHLNILKEKTDRHPSGKKLSFLVTFGREDDEWSQRLTDALSNYQGGNPPDIVRLPDIGLKEIEELARSENKLIYQLNFTRGYGGDLNRHRVRVPGTDYDKFFTTDELK